MIFTLHKQLRTDLGRPRPSVGRSFIGVDELAHAPGVQLQLLLHGCLGEIVSPACGCGGGSGLGGVYVYAMCVVCLWLSVRTRKSVCVCVQVGLNLK